jgi:hypothetical protein
MFLVGVTLSQRIGPVGAAVDHECVFAVGFDGDAFYFRAGEFAPQVVIMMVLFAIETGNKAIHEAVVVGEVSVEFVEVSEDGAESAINGVAAPEGITEL